MLSNGIVDFMSSSKAKKKPKEDDYAYGRISVVPQEMQTISNRFSKTFDLLSRISNESDMVKAIDIIINETPDGKMAYNTYLRLANQGFNISWKNASTGRTVKRYDAEFREFCSRMGANNSAGIDGLLDQLHGSSIAHGGMAVEVVVSKELSDIQEVAIIDPATITEFQWIESEQRYAAYQEQTGGKKADLYSGNFFYIPHQPKPGHPEGTLQFAPAVVTTTQYLQLLNDSLKVIKRIGYPRYDASIDRKAFMESLSDKSPEGMSKAFLDLFETVKANMRRLKENSDFVHFDEVKLDTIGGGVNGAGIDVRAWFEALDPLICNSFQLTPVMLGRLSSGSYSLGTVEFKIITDTVDSMRRNSKRILEQVFKLWARVKGYNIYPVIELKPIDWEKAREKLEAELLKLEKYRRAEEYGYVSKDVAAMETMGVEKADNTNSDGRYEYLTSKGSSDSTAKNDTQNEEVNAQDSTEEQNPEKEEGEQPRE